MAGLITAIGGLLRQAGDLACHRLPNGSPVRELAADGARLFLAEGKPASDELGRHALAVASGRGADRWRIVRAPEGQPHALSGRHRRPISISATDGWKATATAASGAIGVDIETLGRVAANIHHSDDWLHPEERRLLASLPPRERLVEIGCRWAIREAAGKALGLGLAAWTVPPSIGVADRRIYLAGSLAGYPWAGWRFLLRHRGDLLIALAHRP